MDRKLNFKRISDPELIPRKYVEQIKHLDCEPDAYYKHLWHNANSKNKEGFYLPNLNCHLYVLINAKNGIVGYLWAMKQELSKELWVCNISIDQAYWNKGHVFETVMPQLVDIVRREKLKKVIWTTTHPKYYFAHGFKKSKQVMLEATLEDLNGIIKTDCKPDSDAHTSAAGATKSGHRPAPQPVLEPAKRGGQPLREPALSGQSGHPAGHAKAKD